MILAPTPLGTKTLPRQALEADCKACKRFGPCGVGNDALYVGARFHERHYYIPWKEIRRVFKRVAMSEGGFSGKGIFGSMTYLVVQYGNGKEKQCRFKHEADCDKLLAEIERTHSRIPTHSAKAERRLADAKAAEEARYLKELSPEAEQSVQTLESWKAYLGQRPGLATNLVNAAKQKRVVDNLKPGVLVASTVVAVLSVLAAAYGLYGMLSHDSKAKYFLLCGGVIFLFLLTSGLLPSKWTSKKYAQQEWDKAVAAARDFVDALGGCPVPAQYAHPLVLERMIRVLREGRAQSCADALTVMKKDLRALNSSVKVSQQEYDEVVVVKPLFLVCDYQDEL
ncbi:MAG: ATPase P [Oscillospiraceae bacterium]|nr:ATPase P [Oscillospiraceae bacterium]